MSKFLKIQTIFVIIFFSSIPIFSVDNFAGYCLDFDGSGDNIEVADHSTLNITNDITIEVWVKLEDSNENQKIIGKVADNPFSGYLLGVSNGQFYPEFWDNNNTHYVLQSGNVPSSEWTHLAVTRSIGSQITGYINGEIVGSIPSGNDPIGISNDILRIGSAPWNSGEYCVNGKIDEIRLWNVARDSVQIRENMHLSLLGSESGLISYWQFNEGSGITLEDKISGNDGTLINMTDEDWIDSTIPFGDGISNTQTEIAGTVDFTDTGLSMYFNSQSGAEITVTKLYNTANIDPTEPDEVFDSQYWIVNRFGTGTFDADLTFTISEDLAAEDEANPSQIGLFTRSSTSDIDWTYLKTASSVSAANEEATFAGITDFSQFIICRWIQALDTPQNLIISVASDSIYITWDAVTGATSYKVYSSDDPETGFTEDSSGTFFDESWTAPISSEKKFYYVKAIN